MIKEDGQELDVEGADKRVVLAKSFLDKEETTKSIFEGKVRLQYLFCCDVHQLLNLYLPNVTIASKGIPISNNETSNNVEVTKVFARRILVQASKDVLGLIDLRENKTQGDDALKFKYFVEICLVHMGAKNTWNEGRSIKTVSNLFTVADEALTILVLENNAKEWLEVVEDPAYEHKRGDTKYTDTTSFPKPTRQGTNTKRKVARKAKVNKGWNTSGLRRYNALYAQTRKNREGACGMNSMQWEENLKALYYNTDMGDGLSTTEESIAHFYGDEEEGSDDDVVAMSMFDDAIPHEAV